MKSPDEIKKGLEYISIKDVARKLDAWEDGIPYDYVEDAAADAFALIQQLQDDNAEKDERIQQLEAERDAAVESMRSDPHCCYHCANMTKRGICQSEPRADGHCFEWRGVQKEE